MRGIFIAGAVTLLFLLFSCGSQYHSAENQLQTQSISDDAPQSEANQFFRRLNEENVALSKAMFSDLKTCYFSMLAAQKRSQAQRLVQEFDAFEAHTYLSHSGTRFTFNGLLDQKNLNHDLPIAVTSHLLQQLETVMKKYETICGGLMHFNVGFSKYRLLYQALMVSFSSPMKRFSLAQLLKSIRWLGVDNLVKVIDWLPAEARARLPFINEPWSREFIKTVMPAAQIMDHLIYLLDYDYALSKPYLAQAFSLVNPYEVKYEGALANNQVYPFSAYLGRVHFSDPQVYKCMQNAATDIPLDVWQIKDVITQYQTLYSELTQLCPQISAHKRHAILAIEDRMTTWVLPLSFKMGLRKTQQLEATSLTTTQYQFFIDQEKRLALFHSLQSVEKFTALQIKFLRKKPFNHYAAAKFLQVELGNYIPDRRFITALGMSISFVYQLFDAYGKKTYYTQLSTQQIIAGAKADLKLWQAGLTNP